VSRNYWHARFNSPAMGAVYVGDKAVAERDAIALARRSSRKTKSYNPDGIRVEFVGLDGPFTLDESLAVMRAELDAAAAKVRAMIPSWARQRQS